MGSLLGSALRPGHQLLHLIGWVSRQGPYRICEVIGKGTFRLSNHNDCSTVLATTYNMTRLKLYEGEDVRKHFFSVVV